MSELRSYEGSGRATARLVLYELVRTAVSRHSPAVHGLPRPRRAARAVRRAACCGRRGAPALAWFRRADHLGDPRTPLARRSRELVAERTGRASTARSALLTHLRYFGHCFNPVSFYYCFDAAGEHVEAVVAHVTNTPWGERHAYVHAGATSAATTARARVLHGRFAKALHVSPLMGMDHIYDWRLSEPGERLSVHIESHTPTAARARSTPRCRCAGAR